MEAGSSTANNGMQGAQNGQGAQAQVPANPFVAAVAAPIISGAPNENIKKRFDMFERFCQCLNLPDERKAEVLPQYLSGTAQAMYESLSQDERESYETVRNLLIKRLAPVNAADAAMRKLRKRKQKKKEPVHVYASVISRLVNEALPEDGGNVTKDYIKTTMFLEGLRIKNKQLVRFPRPANFDDAVNRARQQEDLDSENDSSSSDSERVVSKVSRPEQVSRAQPPRLVASIERDEAEQRNSNGINEVRRQIQLLTRRVENLGRNQFRSFQNQNMATRPPRFQNARNGSKGNPMQNRVRSMDSRRWTQDGRPICTCCGKAGHIFAACQQNNCFQPSNFQNIQRNNRFQQNSYSFRQYPQRFKAITNGNQNTKSLPAIEYPQTPRQMNLIYLPDPSMDQNSQDSETFANQCYYVESNVQGGTSVAVKKDLDDPHINGNPAQLYDFVKNMAEKADDTLNLRNKKSAANRCLLIETKSGDKPKNNNDLPKPGIVNQMNKSKTNIVKNSKIACSKKDFE